MASLKSTETADGQYYARRGRHISQRIASAAAQKSWKWTFLNLAWTAGPVTFIALQGGHYIGFAKAAPTQSFIYFAGYTIIAGVLAVMASLGHDIFYKPKVRSEQELLLRVNDQLFNLMLASRNAILEQYDRDERKILAAYFLLQGAAIAPSVVGTAVRDLTGSTRLANAARRIESFADQGMESRIADEYAEISEELYAVRERIDAVTAKAFVLLEKRMRGIMPRIQDGIARTEGFIERTLRAAEEEDASLMTLYDAYAMISLAYEMLNGRRIALLDMRVQGDEALERVQIQLDESRHQYRLSLRRRNSAIRLFASLCQRHAQQEYAAEITDSVNSMLDAIKRTLPTLPNHLQSIARLDYQRIIKLHRSVEKHYGEMQRAAERYRKIWDREGAKLAVRLANESGSKPGWLIKEREITLRDREKLKLAHAISLLLSNVEIITGKHLRVYDISDEKIRFGGEDYKRVAMELADLLDEMLDMSQPEEQLAIETSYAPNFGSLDMDLSPQTKAGWASISVEVLHENRRRASHALARNMVDYYHIPLGTPLIDALVQQFGADRTYLSSLTNEGNATSRNDQLPLPLPPVPLEPWERLIRPLAES